MGSLLHDSGDQDSAAALYPPPTGGIPSNRADACGAAPYGGSLLPTRPVVLLPDLKDTQRYADAMAHSRHRKRWL